MTESTTAAPTTGWRGFWNRGGFWKAALAVVAYVALYDGISYFVLRPLLQGVVGSASDAALLWLTYVLPIGIGCLLLVAFAASVGWLRELFGPQPIGGRGWMWIAVAVVVVFDALNFASIDYAKTGAATVIAWLVAGLTIGFAEEVLTRGFVVNLMRKAGHREIAVAAASAGLFAALHLSNLLSGQSLVATLVQVPYTFGFGVLMYLALRVTGNLIWPILLHAATDPSIFMHIGAPVPGTLTSLAALGNPAVTIVGIILLFFVRGRVVPAAGSADVLAPR
jgi:membrane protease YdiL (CAAX protease family)